MREVKDFSRLDYLQNGNERQQEAYRVLTGHKILEKLVLYHPLLAGTIPLEIDIAQSDLDIVCCWTVKDSFIESVSQHFSTYPFFTLKEKIVGNHTTVIAGFTVEGFAVELFGQAVPSHRQAAYRHMLIEHKLLLKHGEIFKEQVVQLKLQGYKTEPAFAQLLGLKGDPYEALLLLEQDLFGS
ncbi:DUF4269 domain-containing protein [Pontibacter sp. BT731]|uniref:DUF4269 domain-containing protein n=1 Tax=Pontibacter coccineus TaxID=3063328 RepID=UPI0026E37D12|nr:DUF4269 domain-containing protein [Pontibacter sp. BT731]MDO6389789.1 DUF4269 domain-containing protein [Pontibacter sp. BT731]